ncbi:hypothetical protein Acy02nite_76660 [Actinoplanes cyaneus]|uniref:HTH merR-type domain-containing protein n=1 Tax=Actinoplanes cyaneus TaxID=52696 RepID=A0A919M4W4_9ACTN|nr:MerR family regulatory protein [Actinoplanes cyaneus]GID69785.1 hypothetical protein Acy02nite_76660 [Actinoplanes cyaneus]
MRIGELAALVGVTTRTVRHYHHLGLLPEPERTPSGHALTARMDAIAGADPSDPRVAALAAEFAAHLPAEMAAAMVAGLEQAGSSHWLDLMTSELASAQVEVLRLLVTTLKERA